MKRALLCLLPALAFAEPTTPDEWYRDGETQYNLGNFDAAVSAFKQGFALETVETKKAAFLYNIAQAYRQAKDCSNAQFFYKRFLSLREHDPLPEQVEHEVEQRISELAACVRQQEEIKGRPPEGPTPPSVPVVVAAAAPHDEPEPDEEPEPAVPESTRPIVSARLAAGVTKLAVGSLGVPLQATVGVFGGKPIALRDNLVVDVGGSIGISRVRWETMADTRASTLTTVDATGAITYGFAPRWFARGELGLGALVVSNTSESPFTHGAKTEGGALATLHVRTTAALEYAVTRHFIATLPLAFAFAPPRAGLAGTIRGFDAMIGVGYRL